MRVGLARRVYDLVFWGIVAGLAFIYRGWYRRTELLMEPVLQAYTTVAVMLLCLGLFLTLNWLREAIASSVISFVIAVTGGSPLNYEKGNLNSNIQKTARRLEKRGQFLASGETFETLELWNDAARVYERGGAFSRAAAAYEKSGNGHKAIELYEKEGNYEMAGVRCLAEGLQERATKNYRMAAEKCFDANQFVRAGEFYEKGQDYNKAGATFESAHRTDEALRCYERAGNTDKVLELTREVHAGELLRKGAAYAETITRCAELLLKSGYKSEAGALLEDSQEFNRAAEVYEGARQWDKAGELYMKTDRFDKAEQAFSKVEDPEAAAELFARLSIARNDPKAAGEWYEKSGKLGQAAESFKRARDFSSAAKVYEKMGRFIMAGEMFSSAKELGAAAEAYAKAFDWRNAAECYEATGQQSQAIEAFANAGNYLKAGMIAVASGEHGKAVDFLQRISPNANEYKVASGFLGTAFYYQCQYDMAWEIFQRVMPDMPATRDTLPVYYAYAKSLEETNPDQALIAFRRILGVDMNWCDTSARVQHLKSRLGTESSQMSADGAPLRQIEAQRASAAPANPVTNLSSSSGVQTLRTWDATESSKTDSIVRPQSGQASATANETRMGTQGRYRLVDELGHSGTIITHKAYDLQLERSVILRTFPVPRAAGQEEKTLAEVATLSKLKHPNLSSVLDSGIMNGSIYIASEFVDGPSLKSFVKAKGPLGVPETKQTLRQILEVLDMAHSNQVWHLNLKPSQVIHLPGSHSIKVTGFGHPLSYRGGESWHSNMTLGIEPQYLAPEQIMGAEVDGRTDIYSIGLLLFYVLTGRSPFEARRVTDPQEIARIQVQSALPRPSTLRATLPNSLDEIFVKCTHKAPSSRYQDVRALLNDLETVESILPSA